MIRIATICFCFASVIVSAQAQAGKIEDVQKIVKLECAKDIPIDQALRWVKDLYLNCIPQTPVQLDDCKVKCQKENSGTVIGQ